MTREIDADRTAGYAVAPPSVRSIRRKGALSWAVASALASAASAQAMDVASLAQAAQNPIASMISLPLQSNTNFDVGPLRKTQEIFNIQPVIPVDLGADWNLVTRTVLPVMSQPALQAGDSRVGGLGDIQFSALLSPKQAAGGWVWGAGLVAQLDSATNDQLGQGAWGLGPTAVVLKLGSPWVYGALVNNVWSVSTDAGRPAVNQMLVQPFVNYNFPDAPGRYLSFSPMITANWQADGGQRWTVPLGLGVGQITRFGAQPVNVQAAGYYNVERPEGGARWQLRLQVQFMFPR